MKSARLLLVDTCSIRAARVLGPGVLFFSFSLAVPTALWSACEVQLTDQLMIEEEATMTNLAPLEVRSSWSGRSIVSVVVEIGQSLTWHMQVKEMQSATYTRVFEISVRSDEEIERYPRGANPRDEARDVR